MATIKSFTDIEQSKKLAEILPNESADMQYISFRHKDDTIKWISQLGIPSRYDIPCWSLAALLNYLKSKNKFPEIKELSDGRFKLTTYIWDGESGIQVSIGDTIVDACYEMILKLNELKIL